MTIDNISIRLAFRQAQTATPPAFRFAWDDELQDYSYQCRTQMDGFIGPDNPPAVIRFYPSMNMSGDYRVNLTKDPTWQWWDTFTALNDGDETDTEYLTGPSRAQFNTTGWAQMAYLGMSGNRVNVLERVGSWVRFETLKPDQWQAARSMTAASHPQFIHHFTCVSFKDGRTVRIDSTGTPRGTVFYPLVTWEGFAWIPARFVQV
jgi:hypothetical protein